MIEARIEQTPIDIAAMLNRAAALDGVGAVATFTGLVRADDGVTELMLEHYPGMTERALHGLCVDAAARWRLTGALLVHRVGAMRPGDAVVMVVTAAPHRADALAACAFLIDRLKTDAPFWKRETRGEDVRWVAARDSDHEAADRWR
ncbi:molybdenum cofactor biosynthesis protein MoaE [Sphingomonas sp. BGYR3]|uniref:molybdenum cofactor biosynthesis protein MoaE n=1 Tax=Sphingomonas sp. BGYR3 TaxID=2975483 RepID=UPI0021A2E3B3|nr:molybdenum cofactor biosynthesis protein MoaE [Sphingomonas sp. BGYR3]MDG5489143.1 molybdenum cofactor biosynthesis protein MoaE [Sphingomonas sp. BGYR3]